MYVKFAFFALVSLLFNLFCILTSPFWSLLSIVLGRNTLPGVLAYVHTHDTDLDQGKPPAPKLWDRFLARMFWICRNPGYGFDAKVLGLPRGETEVIENWNYPIKGYQNSSYTLRYKGKDYFSFRYERQWTKKWYVKLWLGWHPTPKKDLPHMIKVDFNPFKTALD